MTQHDATIYAIFIYNLRPGRGGVWEDCRWPTWGWWRKCREHRAGPGGRLVGLASKSSPNWPGIQEVVSKTNYWNGENQIIREGKAQLTIDNRGWIQECWLLQSFLRIMNNIMNRNGQTLAGWVQLASINPTATNMVQYGGDGVFVSRTIHLLQFGLLLLAL